MKFSILVVDDEQNIRRGLSAFLEEEGYLVYSCGSGKEAITILQNSDIDLVLTDLKMSPINGERLLDHIVSYFATVPVIILTGHGTVNTAVEAMHKGAYDFLTKPVDLNRLLLLMKRALKTRELARKNREIEEKLERSNSSRQIMTKSKAMQRIIETVRQVAPTNSSVLITGESGVGKEVISDLIHRLSNRSSMPLIKVHCAALSQSLLESELFGHERGAFTGAITQKRGRFELADKGSLFMDEVGEIDKGMQVKLLRVLQEREFERVGGEETIKVDTRLIAATNKNLKEEVEREAFREDLFYRLSVVNIEIPPLRERREDIILLAHAFLKKVAQENNKQMKGFEKKVMQVLTHYDWPGNIRELSNCIESAIVMAQGDMIKLDDLPETLLSQTYSNELRIIPGMAMKDVEKQYIHATLTAYKWNKSRTAEVLGIGRKTLHTKIKEYELVKPT